MTDEDKTLNLLSDLEKDILKELKEQDAILSFNNKAMVQIENPHKGVMFFGLGKKVIRSLEEKQLIILDEKGTLRGGEKYILTKSGKKITDHL